MIESVAKQCMGLSGCTLSIAKAVEVARVLSAARVQLGAGSCKACGESAEH